ncbi:MAG TPA: pilus assembly PilX N-terminal domain-containing protein [Wenzhouxiangella sp.]|nr:pilus assembly PilX N-terminal domain-containing protein [Wenzhouxiangella sp.]
MPVVNRFFANHSKQKGVALIIGLIFLLLLTIIGLSSSNTAVMQERMAGNVSQSNVAFQTAEGNLRGVEKRLVRHVEGGSGGLGVQPISWRMVAEGIGGIDSRNNCTLTGWKLGQDRFGGDQFCFEQDDEYFCIAALRSEYDPATDTVYGSPCRPIDRSDGTFGDNFFLTIGTIPKPDDEDPEAPAAVQSIFYWP